MAKVLTKQRYNVLIIACFCLYAFCTAAKSVYTAEIVEIIKHFEITKQAAGMATLMAFITYGLTQLVVAKVLNKLNIPLFILCSAFFGALVYSMFPVCGNIYQIWVLSAFGGILTAGIYPACMAVIQQYLPSALFSRANTVMSLGYSASFALDYLCGAYFVKIDAWELGFWVFGCLFLLSGMFFYGVVKYFQRHTVAENKQSARSINSRERNTEQQSHKKVVIFLLFTGLLGFWGNSLYFGVANWMTNLLHEVFSLSSSVSILLTLLVPLVSYAGSLLEVCFCRRFSFWGVSAAFSMVALVSMVLLACSFSAFVWLTLLVSLVAIISIRGIASLVAFEIPLRSVHIMNAGKSGAVINTFSSVGAAIASPVLGRVIDTGGYMVYYIVLGAMSIIVLLVALFGKKACATVVSNS